MTTEQLKEFYVLSTTLNFSETAEKLFISQSALTRHIQRMEEELDTPLFVRTTRTVALTKEGVFLRAQIPRLLRQATDMESIAVMDAIEAKGHVRISYAAQSLNSRILQFLRNFQEQYADVRLDASLMRPNFNIDMIYGTDILLTPCDYINNRPADIEAAHIANQSALLAVPPYHHFGEEPAVSLFDLRNETLVVPYAHTLEGPYAQLAYLATRKCYGRLTKLTVETEEEALLQVELGYSVMILPHHMKYHVHPHTRTVPISDPECSFPIYVYHNTSSKNGAATLFFNNLLKYFEKESL